MDYKEKVIALLNSQELSDEQIIKLEKIFPELKELENERIRKAIKSAALQLTDIYLQEKYGLKQSDCIAWIEKQGEQKPTVIIPKFRIGDEIKTDNEESLTITKIDEKGYWSGDLFICDFDEEVSWDLIKQKPAWSEDDEKKLLCICAWIKDYPRIADFKDEMYTVANNYIVWLKSLKDKVQPKQEWSEEDEELCEYLIKSIEESDPLPTSIYSDCKRWLKVLKDRVQPQPKQEWNYNDEIIIETIIQEIEKIPSEKFIDNAKNRCLDWLRYRTKSLRPQNRWKPTEEQMKALNEALCHVDDDTAIQISMLIGKLKKL